MMPDEFDWSKLLDTTGLVDTAAPPASIPFMMTKAQKARLRELGYPDDAWCSAWIRRTSVSNTASSAQIAN